FLPRHFNHYRLKNALCTTIDFNHFTADW
ncbi:hypothetical protein VCHC17A1_2521B, partial [Vibrio cholerae HC-17A1]